MNYAARNLRIVNFIVDLTIVLVIWIAAILIGMTTFFNLDNYDFFEEYFTEGGVMVFFYLIYFTYYSFCEIIFSRTIGKAITKTRVVNLKGEKPNWGSILMRSLVRLIPIDWFTYFKNEPVGWHDSAGETIVIKENRVTGANNK